MMKRKWMSTALCMCMLGTTLAGCSAAKTDSTRTDAAKTESTKTETQADGKTKIRMTYWNSEDTVQSLLDYLKTAVPDVEVEFQFIDNSNYNTIVDTQLSAGEGPDIICESPDASLKHAKLGYLADLSQLGSLYSDAGTSVYSYGDSVYALPGISWFEGIYFNKTLFADNGIELPQTFDEFIAVCRQLKEKGVKPLAAGLKSWEPMLKNSMAFVTAEYLSTDEGKNFGKEYQEGKTTLDGNWNPYLEKWSDMIKEGIYTTDMTGIDHDQALEEFASGKAAMFCSGPWDLETIQSKNPELVIDMMPFYGTESSDGWLIGGPGCGFAVNENSKNKEAAMKIVEAISTVEGQKALWENNQGGSSYLEGAKFDLPKAYDSAAKALEAGNVYCPWNEWGAVGGVHEDYGVQLQSYLLGTQDLSGALKNVDAAAKELLEK